jgi:hypothetical protein
MKSWYWETWPLQYTKNYGGEVVDAGGLQFPSMPPPIPLKQSSYCCWGVSWVTLDGEIGDPLLPKLHLSEGPATIPWHSGRACPPPDDGEVAAVGQLLLPSGVEPSGQVVCWFDVGGAEGVVCSVDVGGEVLLISSPLFLSPPPVVTPPVLPVLPMP